MIEMKNFDLNDTLILSFSVRRNIILLKEKKIPFLIVRDTVTKMKYIKMNKIQENGIKFNRILLFM